MSPSPTSHPTEPEPNARISVASLNLNVGFAAGTRFPAPVGDFRRWTK